MFGGFTKKLYICNGKTINRILMTQNFGAYWWWRSSGKKLRES